jgi:hypothetical protein
VVSIDSLGTARDRRYWLARYLRTKTFGREPRLGSDEWTCESDEIILLKELEPGRAQPVWFGSAERTYEFITDASIHRSPNGEIFSVRYCLNGTGGCEQRLFVFLGEALQAVVRDSTWDQVFAKLPAGYRPHKSPPMDLETLTWEHHVAGPGDANCCPSARLYLDMEIAGHVLSVRHARFEIDLFGSHAGHR